MRTKPNVLDFLITLKERKYINKSSILDITSSFGKNKLIKCYVSRHPIMLFENNKNEMLNLIKQRQEDITGLIELELRLNLMTPFKIQPAYTNCLVKAFLSSKYVPIPIIKVYKNKDRSENSSMRSVYAIIGSDVMLEETVRKTTLSTIHLSTDIFRYNYDLVISKEEKYSTPVSVKSGSVQYQNRYNIMNLSKYWRVDIIEYGSDYSIERAKINYEQNRITRIDIEYDPGHFLKDLKKWTPEIIESNENMKEFLKTTKLSEVTEEILQEYIHKLNRVDPTIVLKELGYVLVKIFGILDVDSVNYEKVKERNEKDVKKNMDKEHVENSLFKRMRTFHNGYVKQLLITNAVKKFRNPTLFDISVGKGGDMDKWHKAGINDVYAIDPDGGDIEIAKSRLKSKTYIKGRNYIFEKATISDKDFNNNEKYDIVSCQFTLHYFFKDDEMLETTVKNISNSLKTGGIFMGTTLDGDKVRQVVNNNKYPEYVRATEVDKNSYKWKLLDITDIYGKEDLLEYYVDFEKFIDICKKYKMKLISYTPFSELYKNYKFKDLTDYELYVSKLYSTFEFKKV